MAMRSRVFASNALEFASWSDRRPPSEVGLSAQTRKRFGRMPNFANTASSSGRESAGAVSRLGVARRVMDISLVSVDGRHQAKMDYFVCQHNRVIMTLILSFYGIRYGPSRCHGGADRNRGHRQSLRRRAQARRAATDGQPQIIGSGGLSENSSPHALDA